MRTNVVIDDALMAEAMKVSGLKTKRQAIEEGLRLLVRTRRQARVRRLRGALEWDGSLDDMRRDA
jgi:Arc/MetJ family transcription regulator